MNKTDKRLTDNHLTEKENDVRLKEIKNLPDVSDKAEEAEIEFEEAGLLERIKTRQAINQKEDENTVKQNASQPIQQD